MKKILWLLLLCIFWFVTLYFHVFADISYEDNKLLDRAEEKIFQAIDSEEIKAEKIIESIDIIVSSQRYSERINTLLTIIKDDIQWRYYLWEYSQDNEEMSPEDCYENEYYDENDKTCYIDESTLSDTQEDYLPQGHSTHHHEDTSWEIFEAVYKIVWNDIYIIEWNNDDAYQQVWEIFRSLIPLKFRWDFLHYKVINNPDSDTAAYVSQDEDDYLKWNIVINMSAMYDEDGRFGGEEAYATLIHEFAHVLTLSKTQMRYYPQTENEVLLERFAESCMTNLVQEWCLLETAYLDDFIDTFWTNEKDLQAAQDGKNIYPWKEDQFVTDYAATNPGEDIAESFAYYVMKADISGSTIADKKMQFFESYKNLKNLRLQMRNNLSQIQ